ncbi:hypothetical protein FOXB_05012, partial [Fusarium oxysporum f. sp. conglutinans Fo5176]
LKVYKITLKGLKDRNIIRRKKYFKINYK